ncbi:MAG: Lpg1974 family pore-forming outer membrane protein [Pirellulales bacterium]
MPTTSQGVSSQGISPQGLQRSPVRTAMVPQTTMVHERRVRIDEPQPAMAMGDSWNDGGCGDASCGGCDTCGDDWFSDGSARGRWFAGVDFIFARPHFSEPTAYMLRSGPTLGPGNVLAASDTWVYHNFDYEPSVRGYVGYRLSDCCAELRASYQRLDSGSSRSATTDAGATVVPTYFEVQPGPGNTLTANMDVGGDVFDIDFSRCIRAGGECIPCDCRTCPDWDLQWSAGARLARWDLNADVFTNSATDGRLDIDQEFIGAGPKIGLEGRRYFGCNKQFTVYSTFDASLLVGWYEHAMSRNIPSVGVNPATVESFENKMTRTVPVTEIEIGMRWQPYERLNLSAGWFFQAWWDLGMSTQATSNLLGGLGPQFLLDDSNIMSWDGLTVRAEYTF